MKPIQNSAELEICPDCGIQLPRLSSQGKAHRYIGASPSCWGLFSNLLNAGEPPISPGRFNPLLLDAYCVQHPGKSSLQSIQSVAGHGLVLYGVFALGVDPKNALWIRRRALRTIRGKPKQTRFHWLTPPSSADNLTIGEIVNAPTPLARTEQLHAYIQDVWSIWSAVHHDTLAEWYANYVSDD